MNAGHHRGRRRRSPRDVAIVSRELLAWVLATWDCTIADQTGADLTDRYRAGRLDALYAR